jgi:hypothetical protein
MNMRLFQEIFELNQAFERVIEGLIRVRFTDNTELCWRIVTATLIGEADLADWKTGNFRQLKYSCRMKAMGRD